MIKKKKKKEPKKANKEIKQLILLTTTPAVFGKLHIMLETSSYDYDTFYALGFLIPESFSF